MCSLSVFCPIGQVGKQTKPKVTSLTANDGRTTPTFPTPHLMTPLACREVNKGDELQLSIKQQVPNECWRQNCYLHLIFLLVFNAARATATRLPIHQFNGRICNTPENCLYIIYQKPLFCNRLLKHPSRFFLSDFIGEGGIINRIKTIADMCI